MAIGYLDMVTHTRARGHSAAAAIAYRFGVLLVDVRTGAVHDYLERHTREDIADTGIEAYRDTPLVADAQTLANAIEGAERRRDARILRDWKVALPHELDEAQRIELTKTISRDIAKRYDTVIAWAVHRPRSDGDARNHHAHFVIPTRALDADGHLGAKLRVFDNPRTSGDEIAYLRNRHADLANLALERAGRDERIDVGQIVEGVPVESASHGLVAEARKSQRWPKRTAARDVISAAVAADGLESERAQRIAQAYRRRNARKPRQERYAESRRARWQRRSAVAELGDWLPPVIEPEAATTLDPVARPRHMPPIAAPTVISAPRRVERKPEADARPVRMPPPLVPAVAAVHRVVELERDARPVRLPPAPAPAVAAAPRSVVVEPDARPRHIPPIAAPTVISAPRRVERKPEADARPVRMPPPLVPAVAAVHRVFELERDARPVRLPPAPAPAVAAAPRSVVADPDARPRSIPSALNADRSIAELRARSRELMDSLEQAQAEIAPHQRRLAAYLEQHLDRIIGEMCRSASLYSGPPVASIELEGVPDPSPTPGAICRALAIAIENPITRIRAGKTHRDRLDSARRIADEWPRDLDPATRAKIVADVTAAALPGYSAEWLPPVGDDDPRGREQALARKRDDPPRSPSDTEWLARGAERRGETAELVARARAADARVKRAKAEIAESQPRRRLEGYRARTAEGRIDYVDRRDEVVFQDDGELIRVRHAHDEAAVLAAMRLAAARWDQVQVNKGTRVFRGLCARLGKEHGLAVHTDLAPPDHEPAPETTPVDPTVARLAELYRQHASGDQGIPKWRLVDPATASDDPNQLIAMQLELGGQILDKGSYSPRQIASAISLARSGGLEDTDTYLGGMMEGIKQQKERERGPEPVR